MEDVSKRAGVTAHCMTKWRRGETLPKLPDMRAALGALGFKLVIKGEE